MRLRDRLITPTALTAALVATVLAVPAAPAATAEQAPTTTQSAPTAQAATAPASSGNPLASRTWGVYRGKADQSWQPYVDASGHRKRLLGYIAHTPKAKWFGHWIPDDEITEKVRDYIDNAQAGDPDALVQMSVFRMVPWEGEACKRLPTLAEQRSYKIWMRRFADGIGDAHAAVVMQPDGPFAFCAPGGSRVPSDLVAYGTRVVSEQPNTSVYVEVGASDWPHRLGQGGAEKAAELAVRFGVRHARGIALNGTHYASTAEQIQRGAEVSRILARRGLPGKKVVINTSGNGHPFTYGKYTGADADNPMVCQSRTAPASQTCITLGIPPTPWVAAEKWRLPDRSRRLARRYVDAYLWFGRPWLYRQNDPFVMERALDLVRSTPWR